MLKHPGTLTGGRCATEIANQRTMQVTGMGRSENLHLLKNIGPAMGLSKGLLKITYLETPEGENQVWGEVSLQIACEKTCQLVSKAKWTGKVSEINRLPRPLASDEGLYLASHRVERWQVASPPGSTRLHTNPATTS
jgi:hypothetical protein